MFHYAVLYGVRYVRMSPNNVPNLECLPHCMKAGLGSVANIGMFKTRLYGDVWIGGSWLMESGRFKCRGIRD